MTVSFVNFVCSYQKSQCSQHTFALSSQINLSLILVITLCEAGFSLVVLSLC